MVSVVWQGKNERFNLGLFLVAPRLVDCVSCANAAESLSKGLAGENVVITRKFYSIGSVSVMDDES